MSGRGGGSGVRYREYRRALSAGATEGAQPSSSRRSQPRHRSVRELMRIFWTLLGGVRGTITVALTAITISAVVPRGSIETMCPTSTPATRTPSPS